MKIITTTNKDKDFYKHMGPFLAKRNIEKEIGYKIYDDDEKQWIVAFEMNEVVGFCYIQHKKTAKKHYIGSCYVTQKHRRMGVFERLLKKTIDRVKTGDVIMVTDNEIIMKVLINFGFRENKRKGHFFEYKKEVNDE